MPKKNDFYAPPHSEPPSSSPAPSEPAVPPGAPTNLNDLLSTFLDFYPKLLVPLVSVSLPLGIIYALHEAFNVLIAPDAGLLLIVLITFITFLSGTYFWCVAVHQVDDIFRGGDGDHTPWDRGTERFIPILMTLFVVSMISGVGLLLCVIPGLLALFFLLVAEFPVVLEKTRPMEGLKRSFELVKHDLGYTFRIFALLCSAGIVFALVAGFLFMFIGQSMETESLQLMIAILFVPTIIFLYPAAMAVNYLLYQGLCTREADRLKPHPAPAPQDTDDPTVSG